MRCSVQLRRSSRLEADLRCHGMTTKTGRTRLEEGLAYLRDTGWGAGLANEVAALVGHNQEDVGNALSLGSRWDIGLSQTVSQKRRALRALLLCQRVYFSDLWPTLAGTPARRQTFNWLGDGADWKTDSLSHWHRKTEQQICEGIQAFVSTTSDANLLARVARAGSPGEIRMSCLTQTRTGPFEPADVMACWDAIMAWTFKSGLTSLRWYRKHSSANSQQTLEAAFGVGKVIWDGSKGRFTEASELPPISAGMIVHIYDQRRWNGHWIISNGKSATACGCNNYPEDPEVPKAHSAMLSIKKQFLNFNKGVQGIAVVIDPLKIPGRD